MSLVLEHTPLCVIWIVSVYYVAVMNLFPLPRWYVLELIILWVYTHFMTPVKLNCIEKKNNLVHQHEFELGLHYNYVGFRIYILIRYNDRLKSYRNLP